MYKHVTKKHMSDVTTAVTVTRLYVANCKPAKAPTRCHAVAHKSQRHSENRTGFASNGWQHSCPLLWGRRGIKPMVRPVITRHLGVHAMLWLK